MRVAIWQTGRGLIVLGVVLPILAASGAQPRTAFSKSGAGAMWE